MNEPKPDRLFGPDFVVLTGFLGSGKTTLLRDFLATDEASGTAIIVNEVGAIKLDESLLRESGGEVAGPVAMTMLANGCVCCQLGSDLSLTVEALLAAERPAGARPLRRIVLETSGLSKPGPVLRQLAALGAHRMRALVVATFDAVRGVETSGFEEAAAQWAGAQRIVITKADAVPPKQVEAARALALGMNPLAEVVGTADRHDTVTAAFAAPTLVASAPLARLGRAARGVTPHPRLATFLLRQPAPLSYDDIAAWLDNLAGALGERLLRLKGLVGVEGSKAPLLVQSVGTMFAAPRPFRGPSPDDRPFLVLIGRDLLREEIEAVPPRYAFHLSGPGDAATPDQLAPGRFRADAI